MQGRLGRGAEGLCYHRRLPDARGHSRHEPDPEDGAFSARGASVRASPACSPTLRATPTGVPPGEIQPRATSGFTGRMMGSRPVDSARKSLSSSGRCNPESGQRCPGRKGECRGRSTEGCCGRRRHEPSPARRPPQESEWAARMPMIAMTVRSSMSVNPALRRARSQVGSGWNNIGGVSNRRVAPGNQTGKRKRLASFIIHPDSKGSPKPWATDAIRSSVTRSPPFPITSKLF